ncbi:hypothetical protein A2U01_0111440, partial [Trifolium medium]|nr:hypothetical protein [Trifolium medium]
DIKKLQKEYEDVQDAIEEEKSHMATSKAQRDEVVETLFVLELTYCK